MAHRIEVRKTVPDGRARVKRAKYHRRGFSGVKEVEIVDAYTIDAAISAEGLKQVAQTLTNPVIEEYSVDEAKAPKEFDWAIQIGYGPGVTDNVGNTVREQVQRTLGITSVDGNAYRAEIIFLKGNLTREQVEAIASTEANPITQIIQVKSKAEFYAHSGMSIHNPIVSLGETPEVTIVDILNASKDELERIGSLGIVDYKRELSLQEYTTLRLTHSGNRLKLGDIFEEDKRYYEMVRRGPLALTLNEIYTITNYFRKIGRNPTDIELETLAQTWSEHCQHKKLKSPIDDIKDGLYRLLQRATEEVRRLKGEKDFCVSVFKDNSGIIEFDEEWLLTDKMETHNKPSSLDGYGGAATGIGGVIRDAIGAGLGALPIMNAYWYLFGDIDSDTQYYRGRGKALPFNRPSITMETVIEGVRDYGNRMGIPTALGDALFDKNFLQPLVFVRTIGLMPRESAGRPCHEKKAEPGDLIYMIGGRVGRDGIHGATFSSVVIDSTTPVTAVQIGDPITEKKFTDAAIKRARDRGLYRSVTDNGAGGLACSVGEMGEEAGGAEVDLKTVPLKYAGLRMDEVWISEAQERMTVAVPPENEKEFVEIMESEGVEATRIGKFTDSGRCVVRHDGKVIMDLEMEFLHRGWPKEPQKTTFVRTTYEEPEFDAPADLTNTFLKFLGRLNVASTEFISMEYDHEVQARSVLKQVQGKGRAKGPAVVMRPLLDSNKGIVASYGIDPFYSQIDTYDMAACAIDTAIRNTIVAGANPDEIALMDNLCWCSSDKSERMGQFKRAVRACHDYAIKYKAPFIAGKDSMNNDAKVFDGEGNPLTISVHPTLLVSTLGIIEDVRKSVSLDAQREGDLVYLLGETRNELGGSEYFRMVGEEKEKEFVGNNAPKVDAEINMRLYRAYAKAADEEIIASAIGVDRGGLAKAMALTTIGGRLGMDVSLEGLPGNTSRDDYTIFSQSMGRIIVTIAPENKKRFEQIMGRNVFKQIGTITSGSFRVRGLRGDEIINTSVDEMIKPYRQRFEGY